MRLSGFSDERGTEIVSASAGRGSRNRHFSLDGRERVGRLFLPVGKMGAPNWPDGVDVDGVLPDDEGRRLAGFAVAPEGVAVPSTRG